MCKPVLSCTFFSFIGDHWDYPERVEENSYRNPLLCSDKSNPFPQSSAETESLINHDLHDPRAILAIKPACAFSRFP